MTLEFKPWPKIARLNREIIVTEKIDGTNAAIVIVPEDDLDHIDVFDPEPGTSRRRTFYEPRPIEIEDGFGVLVQSRKRFIAPGDDNYGFATWVSKHARPLVRTLGPGTHYGEWWGQKIQRGYGLDHNVFSLFNTSRWKREAILEAGIDGLDVVPTLYQGPFSEFAITSALDDLQHWGSLAAEQRGAQTKREAEGVVVFHTALNGSFKVTIKGDEAPKGAAGHALDEG